jgi:hypothetical protein
VNNSAWQPGYEQCSQIEPAARGFLARENKKAEAPAASSDQETLRSAAQLLKHTGNGDALK